MELNGKRALVTGAAGGIGRAVALALAAGGARLALTDTPAAARELAVTVAQVEQSGGTAWAQGADLRDRAAVFRLASAATDALGGIDVLVNVAGVHLYPSPLLTVSESDWNRVQDVNVKGPLFLCQAVVPGMISLGGGSVINVASDSAFDVIADEGAYGISKIAVVRMSSYLAKELSGTGVRVNSLAPGWVRTGMSEPFRKDPVAFAASLAAVPAGRIAEPADIANVVVFLASERAAYVNGHCIVVDGGRIAGVPA